MIIFNCYENKYSLVVLQLKQCKNIWHNAYKDGKGRKIWKLGTCDCFVLSWGSSLKPPPSNVTVLTAQSHFCFILELR